MWRQPNLELFPPSSALREKSHDLHKHLGLFWGPHGHPGPQCLPAAMEKQSPQTRTGSPGLQARGTKAKQRTETWTLGRSAPLSLLQSQPVTLERGPRS